MRGVTDAANLGFVQKQTSHIESEVIEMEYPEIRYAQDVPVDTSANAFAKSVTFYSMDKVGRAKVINGHGDDIPLANAEILQHETEVTMAGIGYGFSLEEIGQAQMLGMNLDGMGAEAANYSYEKFMDDVAFIGFSGTSGGLFNYAGVTTAAAGGAWSGRTPQQILADFNTMITGPYAATNGVEIPNCIRLPIAVMGDITTRQIAPESTMTILEYVQAKNVYTAQTGMPLDVRGDYRLTTRAVAYHKSPRVLKMHIPMPLRFLPVQPRNLEYVVPGMFRTGGLDIRRPGAVRYVDGVA
jgi:hypothetical protein